MASRPLHPNNGTRSPDRQNVAQRWLNSVASAPSAPKPTHLPVKRWPPPKDEAPLSSAPVVAKSTSTTATEPASAFRSARSVFEAKKSIASVPPPPPTRHRLTFPASPPASVVKQHSDSSDLSTSSCSTADSEGDRTLEETVEARKEPMSMSPVRAIVKRIETESVAATPSKQVAAKASVHTIKLVPSPAARDVQVHAPRNPAVILTIPKQEEQCLPNCNEIGPFRLLLPVEAIPTLPDEVIRVYDNAAVDMEKNIKKVVRKLLNKDKSRLEEFKVNSRLFGTDFMDAHAYLDTLIKDFGSIRALQLVPCLLSVQPSMVKCNALLLAAKNCLLRNENVLEREVKKLRASSPQNITSSSKVAASPVGDVASNTSPAGASTKAHSVVSPIKTLQVDNMVNLKGGSARNVFGGPADATTLLKGSSSRVQPTIPGVVAIPTAILVQKEPASLLTEEVTTTKEIKSAEPMPEPQVLPSPATPPPLINIAVSAPFQKSGTAPTAPKLAPSPVVKYHAELETTSHKEEQFRAENLFGKLSPQKQQQNSENKSSRLDDPAALASPASSVRSFDEAESLFGERLSSSSRTSPGRRKTVTWGDNKTMVMPAQNDSPVKTKKTPAPLLFGLATAAAFDSDESDFSD